MIFTLYEIASLIYSILFAVLTIRLVHRHQNKMLDYFSNVEEKQIKWVKTVAIFIIVFYCMIFIPLFLSEELIADFASPIYSAINVIFIYWIGISGIRQPKIEMSFEINSKEPLGKTESNIKVTSEIVNGDKTFQQLLDLMENEQFFNQPDLTLPTLAHQLKTTRRNLSQLINPKAGTNFNRFINRYRVEEAKKMLADSNFDHLNMLGIAFDVGFSSKPTFFAVFKQIEGISPGAYKKQLFKKQ